MEAESTFVQADPSEFDPLEKTHFLQYINIPPHILQLETRTRSSSHGWLQKILEGKNYPYPTPP